MIFKITFVVGLSVCVTLYLLLKTNLPTLSVYGYDKERSKEYKSLLLKEYREDPIIVNRNNLFSKFGSEYERYIKVDRSDIEIDKNCKLGESYSNRYLNFNEGCIKLKDDRPFFVEEGYLLSQPRVAFHSMGLCGNVRNHLSDSPSNSTWNSSCDTDNPYNCKSNDYVKYIESKINVLMPFESLKLVSHSSKDKNSYNDLIFDTHVIMVIIVKDAANFSRNSRRDMLYHASEAYTQVLLQGLSKHKVLDDNSCNNAYKSLYKIPAMPKCVYPLSVSIVVGGSLDYLLLPPTYVGPNSKIMWQGLLADVFQLSEDIDSPRDYEPTPSVINRLIRGAKNFTKLKVYPSLNRYCNNAECSVRDSNPITKECYKSPYSANANRQILFVNTLDDFLERWYANPKYVERDEFTPDVFHVHPHGINDRFNGASFITNDTHVNVRKPHEEKLPFSDPLTAFMSDPYTLADSLSDTNFVIIYAQLNDNGAKYSLQESYRYHIADTSKCSAPYMSGINNNRLDYFRAADVPFEVVNSSNRIYGFEEYSYTSLTDIGDSTIIDRIRRSEGVFYGMKDSLQAVSYKKYGIHTFFINVPYTKNVVRYQYTNSEKYQLASKVPRCSNLLFDYALPTPSYMGQLDAFNLAFSLHVMRINVTNDIDKQTFESYKKRIQQYKDDLDKYKLSKYDKIFGVPISIHNPLEEYLAQLKNSPSPRPPDFRSLEFDRPDLVGYAMMLVKKDYGLNNGAIYMPRPFKLYMESLYNMAYRGIHHMHTELENCIHLYQYDCAPLSLFKFDLEDIWNSPSLYKPRITNSGHDFSMYPNIFFDGAKDIDSYYDLKIINVMNHLYDDPTCYSASVPLKCPDYIRDLSDKPRIKKYDHSKGFDYNMFTNSTLGHFKFVGTEDLTYINMQKEHGILVENIYRYFDSYPNYRKKHSYYEYFIEYEDVYPRNATYKPHPRYTPLFTKTQPNYFYDITPPNTKYNAVIRNLENYYTVSRRNKLSEPARKKKKSITNKVVEDKEDLFVLNHYMPTRNVFGKTFKYKNVICSVPQNRPYLSNNIKNPEDYLAFINKYDCCSLKVEKSGLLTPPNTSKNVVKPNYTSIDLTVDYRYYLLNEIPIIKIPSPEDIELIPGSDAEKLLNSMIYTPLVLQGPIFSFGDIIQSSDFVYDYNVYTETIEKNDTTLHTRNSTSKIVTYITVPVGSIVLILTTIRLFMVLRMRLIKKRALGNGTSNDFSPLVYMNPTYVVRNANIKSEETLI